MSKDSKKERDQTDWQLLLALQENARASYSELGRKVGLSTPAVIDRIRKMEEGGVIKGYRVEIDPKKLGYDITAFVHLESHASEYDNVLPFVKGCPEIEQCHYITGRASFIFKINVTSIGHLESFIKKVAAFGNTDTSVIMSSPVEDKPLYPPQKKSPSNEGL